MPQLPTAITLALVSGWPKEGTDESAGAQPNPQVRPPLPRKSHSPQWCWEIRISFSGTLKIAQGPSPKSGRRSYFRDQLLSCLPGEHRLPSPTSLGERARSSPSPGKRCAQHIDLDAGDQNYRKNDSGTQQRMVPNPLHRPPPPAARQSLNQCASFV